MKYADTDIIINRSLLNRLEEKKKRLDRLRPLKKDSLQKLLEDIRIRHTYHSDAIEGNTLTLQETKLVLEEGITIGGKPLKDHIEAKNDAEAFDLMIKLSNEKKAITQETIQQIHEVVTKGLLESSGRYRTENVRIGGSKTSPPSYLKILKLMEEFISEVNSLKLHPIKMATFIHFKLVAIHPFLDGNGRVARLVTNLYIISKGYSPIILKKEDRRRYYSVLQKADKGDLSPFAEFISRAVNESLMTYLSSFVKDDFLVPLKELAKLSSYSQEYLSLRARQGKIDAVKEGNVWYSSKHALNQYLKIIR